MIIDCHTHIFPKEMRNDRESYCEKDHGFSALYKNLQARMVGAEELIASMDRSGVERSAVCGFSWTRPDLCAQHNQYLLESASRFPNRLTAFISLPWTDPARSETELKEGIQGGAKGVGEVAFYDRELTPCELDGMGSVLTVMEQRRIPLLLHTNETLGHSYPGKGRTPLERFYELILRFPRLPIVLAHWGGGLPFYELMPEVMKAMTHVYYDTAASPFLYSKRIYPIVCKIVGPEKILFGSDFPLLPPERYFEELMESGLGKEDQEKILGLNFLRLLGLEQGEAR